LSGLCGSEGAVVQVRIMQRAESVDAAIAIFEKVGNRGGTGFVVLADAAGNIAQVECIPSRFARRSRRASSGHGREILSRRSSASARTGPPR
jgi:hypothetical protein